ncbi:DUF2059 domain-containing protein [Mesorhizobium yinganensis]|uniref:DUF2059 domain-containing protein n=1 Tax=Mesorhizobium yinganensis TaxID=3157707 RepID=UPI0032B7B453
MIWLNSIRRLASVAFASAVVFSALPVFAQDISEDHLKAARTAIAAIGATEVYDGILPDAAAALKQSLIQKNPDLQELIVKTVDETTISLAPRRADLEKEAALIYAKTFSVEELNAITSFYESPAGKKLLSDGPVLIRSIAQAAEIWQRGVARDLADNVGKAINAAVPAKPAEAAAPADGQPKAN